MQTLSARRGLKEQLPLFTRRSDSPRDVDLHAYSRPARTYTGDFYLTHRYDDVLWLAMGDVVGKGLHAAVIMGMIQEELEQRLASCATSHCDPSATMAHVDLFLRSVLASNQFATAVIAKIHDSGVLSVANAGHCPLFIARRDGTIETIGSTGPVAGLLPGARWRAIEVPFRRGDTLLAYTDGAIEARSDDDEEFGLSRLREAFASALSARTAREVGTAIAKAVESFAAGKHDDDLTIVVARR